MERMLRAWIDGGTRLMQIDPWMFGWTQLLTLVGFAITIGIAWGGFKNFNRWRREKLEERRIEIAFEVLSLAYESKYVFDHIRSPVSAPYEWKDMAKQPGETDEEWNQRGPYYAVNRRIALNKSYVERVFAIQPKCMAVFGQQAEDIFILLHKARREIEVASEMLAWKVQNPIGPVPARDSALIR